MEVKKEKNRHNFKVFLGYFLSYIAVLFLLFLTIGGYSYYSIVTEKMRVAKEEINSYMSGKTQWLDEKLVAAMNVSMSFYRDREVSKIRNLSRGFQPKEYPRFQSLQTTLQALTKNGYISCIGLYFHESELLVASDMIDDRPWVYYDLWPFPLPAGYDNFRDAAVQAKPGTISVLDKQGDVVTLGYAIPFSDSQHGVTVLSSVNIAGLLALDGISGEYKNAEFLLLDNEGELLFRQGNAHQGVTVDVRENGGVGYNSDTIEHYQQRSLTLGWTLNLFIEKKELYSDSVLIHRNLLMVCVVFFLLSLILAVLMASRISRPVTELSKICNTAGERPLIWNYATGVELKKIVSSISNMSQRNTDLAIQVHCYREGIRNNFFQKLLAGETVSRGEMQMVREDMAAFFDYTYYTAAVLKLIHNGDEAETEQEIWVIGRSVNRILELLEKNRRENVFFCKTDFDEITLIGCSNKDDMKASLTQYLHGLSNSFYQESYRACWGVGNIVANTDQVFVSYFNAVQTLNNLDAKNIKDSVLFAGADWDWQRIQYPLEDEQRLLNSLSQGDHATAQSVLREIFGRNHDGVKKSRKKMGMFVAALSNTVIRAENILATEAGREKINLYLWQMKNVGDLVVLARYMDVISQQFAEIATSRNASKQQRLISKISDHILASYSDTELCLSSIAGKFGLTESYVSTFFKQVTGKNISQYIERVRMEKTVALLQEGNKSTTQIAQTVGYSNMNTFYKAFKRHYGINPKAYKERIEKEAV